MNYLRKCGGALSFLEALPAFIVPITERFAADFSLAVANSASTESEEDEDDELTTPCLV